MAAIRVDPKAQAVVAAAKFDDDHPNDEEESHDSDHNNNNDMINLANEMAMTSRLNNRSPPFPRPLVPDGVDDAYYVGHHSEKSFGAVPYLVRGRTTASSSSSDDNVVWVMIDTPKYGVSAKDAITKLTGLEGPDYLFMTHIDDTAHHGEWAKEFPNMKRIFHAADLGRNNWIGDKTLEKVDVLLKDTSTEQQLAAFTLDGTPISLQEAIDNDGGDEPKDELLLIHTPGHSPGSTTLWKRPTRHAPTGILFTGDTYGYSRWRKTMSGFPRYGRSLSQQAATLQLMLQTLDWQIIAPGHGHLRDYRQERDGEVRQVVKRVEMEEALDQFQSYQRRW